MGAEKLFNDSAQVYVLENSLLSRIQLRELRGDGEVRLLDGMLVAINVVEGTLDVQYEFGLLRGVERYCWENKTKKRTWCWPHAEDAADPAGFKADDIKPKGKK